jgi:membrane-associated phospholipid phosphatase
LTTCATAILLGAALLGTTPAAAGTEDPPRVAELPGDLARDLGALPSTGNAWWLLGGTALTVIVYQFEDAEGAARALDQGALDGLADFGNIWGDIRVQGTLALGTWATGSWSGSPRTAGTGYALSRGLLLSYAAVSLLKTVVERERPDGEPYSFPSGHTAAAFSTAGVLTRRYGGWAGGTALFLGGLTAAGRLEDLKHYPSDVVAGAAIGWIVGRTVARAGSADPRAWRVVPLGAGLAVAKGF